MGGGELPLDEGLQRTAAYFCYLARLPSATQSLGAAWQDRAVAGTGLGGRYCMQLPGESLQAEESFVLTISL